MIDVDRFTFISNCEDRFVYVWLDLERVVLSVHEFLFPVIFSLLLKYIYRK